MPFILKSSGFKSRKGADMPGTWFLGTRSLPFPVAAPANHSGNKPKKPAPTYSKITGIDPMRMIWPMTDPGCGIFNFATLSQNFLTGSGYQSYGSSPKYRR